VNDIDGDVAVVLYVYAVVYVIYYCVVAAVDVIKNVALVAVQITEIEILLGRANLSMRMFRLLRKRHILAMRLRFELVAHQVVSEMNRVTGDITHL